MTSRQPTGRAASVLDRLKSEARRTGRPAAELLELYAVERVLHRLGLSAHRDRFVLKGALLLREWLGEATRPTKDIDLLGPTNLEPDELRRIIEEILQVEVEEDGIEFLPESIVVRPIRIGSAVLGLRAKFDGRIARTRLRYQVDVGLGDSVYPPAVDTTPASLLGLPVASLRAYTPYTAVAEKLEAIVNHGEVNSRTKDYYDLYRLPQALGFDGAILLESLKRTFGRRATAVPPTPLAGLTDEFAEAPLQGTRWSALLSKGQLQDVEPDFVVVVRGIRRFADPVLQVALNDQEFELHWEPGGPWK